jgi:gliding motility-associated-like protein
LNSQYCTSLNPITLTPAVPGGYFDGYALDAQNSFVPSQVGKFKLHYIISTLYCRDTPTKDFEVFQTPMPNLGPDLPICDAPNSMQVLNANYTPGSYRWNTTSISDTTIVYNSGKYWVEVTDGICTASDTILVDYAFTPKVELGKDTSVCKGNRMELNAAYPKSTYLWQDGTTDSILVAYTPGKYTVVVQNICGRAEDSVFVFFQTDYCDLFMANAFSPDNDLINSEFKPLGKNITIELFEIYNRWGQMVFSTDKDNVGWNGQFMGKAAPQDLYIWKLFYTTPSGKYIKKSNASGTVLLIR